MRPMSLSEGLKIPKDNRPGIEKAKSKVERAIKAEQNLIDTIYTWKFQSKFWGAILFFMILIPVISIK